MPTKSGGVKRDIAQQPSRPGSRLIVVRVSTHDLLWPNEFFVRANDFAKRRSNEPQRNSTSDQGIEERISRGSYENASKHRGKRDVDIADVMDVCQANGCVVLTRGPK